MHRIVSSSTGVILLIEDDPGDRELLKLVVESMSISSDLRFAKDGEDALDYLYRRGRFADIADSPTPDLIILDLNMPKLGGRELLVQLRGSQEFRVIPIVVLTTSSRQEDVDKCYEYGCNSYITKPSDVTDFNQAVEHLSRYWLELVTLPNDPMTGQ